MDQPNHKVKIPCNHQLEFMLMRFAGIHKSTCAGCGKESARGFYCLSCKFQAHEECIDWPDIINHPCHSRHPLKKVLTETVDYTDGRCHFCRDELGDQMYHCSICNFSIDKKCWVHNPKLTIHHSRSHDHTFTLLPIKVSFTCTACEMIGDRNPYVCLECGFMLHQDCISLPRVININRHDHHISRSYHLGHGDWECGVCREKMDWPFGAFSCKRCPNYAVHSKCATRDDVWDGEELEDEPEEEDEEDPYKEINEKEIIHFSHEEHNLRLGDDNIVYYEKMRCDACILPINSDTFFKCVQCKFFLHKVCASLPRKKRNILHNHKVDLRVRDKAGKYFKCTYCLQFFDGFRYKCNSLKSYTSCFLKIDVRCGSISEPFNHELHPHPLYRTSIEPKTCGACGKDSEYVLSCTSCKFALCMECATLPRKVKHRCDDHVLSLHFGDGNSNGQLWCDICEEKTDPRVWFYGCDSCGTTLHIKCVLGDMFYFKPGNKYLGAELVSNDGMTRPFCIVCEKRCLFPSYLKAIVDDSTVEYGCSMGCCAKENVERAKTPNEMLDI